jgi:hypothetical protein
MWPGARCFFFPTFNFVGWGDTVRFVLRPLIGLLYQHIVQSIWWNENWQCKPQYSQKSYPGATLSTTNTTLPNLGSNPGESRWEARRLTAWAMARCCSRFYCTNLESVLQCLSFPTFIEVACQGAAEDEGTRSLRNVGNLRQDYTASHPRRQQFLAVNIFVNIFNFLSTVVHSCVSIAMFLNGVLAIFILRIYPSFWWRYMNIYPITNQPINHCLRILKQTCARMF